MMMQLLMFQIAVTFFICGRNALEVKPCNPLLDSNCEGLNEALASTISESFRDYSDYFDVFSENGKTSYTKSGLKLTIAERYDNPSIKSNFYIFFGKVEVTVKTAKGQGIVSSVFLQSDDLDEIDLEWIGGDPYTLQTNYFVRGNTSDYSRSGYHSMDNTQSQYHTYTIDWTLDSLKFSIDGTEVRNIQRKHTAKDYGYPETPMLIYVGAWVGGDKDNEKGTIEWAGGVTNYQEAPYIMKVEKIVVTDYSSGKFYQYVGNKGDWKSVKSVGGEVNGRILSANKEFKVVAHGKTKSKKTPSLV